MLYAAYGSNLHPTRLTQRIASAQLVGTALLPDWALRFHKLSKDGSGKCSIEKGGDGVHVAVFDISLSDKVVLDDIEGLGKGYAAIALDVDGFGLCDSYVAEDTHIDDSLRPYDWYKELVLVGARFHSLADDYVERIEAVPSIADPDAARSAEQWRVVEFAKTGNR